MTCSEERVVAFLGGELDAEEAAELDDHLLACEECWMAVREDRAGRRLVERLLEPLPAGLADRVSLSIELAARAAKSAAVDPRDGAAAGGPRRLWRPVVRPRPSSGRPAPWAARRRTLLAAAVAAAAAAVAVPLALSVSGGGAADPPAVAAVVAMASTDGGAPSALAAQHTREQVMIGGRPVELSAYRVHGVLTLVATARRPFAMPASTYAAGSSAQAWMATRGAVGVYCLNAPPGGESMLLAAVMPAVALPGVALRLGLVSR